MNRQRGEQGFKLIELMIVVAIIGLLAAIAIPNFLRFQAKAKQSEVRSNLKSGFTSQKAHFAARDRFSILPLEVGFQPERNNRFAYFFAKTVLLEDRSGPTASGGAGATGIGVDVFRGYLAIASHGTLMCGTLMADVMPTSSNWTGAAAGNIDTDSTLDQWTISTDSRTLAGCDAEGPVSSGEPANEQNDVNR